MRLPQDIFLHKPSAGSLRQSLFGGVRNGSAFHPTNKSGFVGRNESAPRHFPPQAFRRPTPASKLSVECATKAHSPLRTNRGMRRRDGEQKKGFFLPFRRPDEKPIRVVRPTYTVILTAIPRGLTQEIAFTLKMNSTPFLQL